MSMAFIKGGAAGVALLTMAFVLSGCGNSMEERVGSGALIGAGTGAVLGGNVGSAALGALAGAGTGAVVNEVDKSNDKKKRKP